MRDDVLLIQIRTGIRNSICYVKTGYVVWYFGVFSNIYQMITYFG